MTQELLYDKRGDIGWITFNRPQARNALTFASSGRTGTDVLAQWPNLSGKSLRGRESGS